MKRKIIEINEEKCIGCEKCANTCKQSAIEMVDGKAKVVREDVCDGIGMCLPVCPVGAITFGDKEIENKETITMKTMPMCPSMQSKDLKREETETTTKYQGTIPSQLQQWPVQIKLVPERAPYFQNANLLVAADCSAFAYGNFHRDFMKNKVTIIGCPKLDMIDYTEKLTAILASNEIKSLTIVRMEVPCCSGIEFAAVNALKNSGKFIPWQVHTIGIDGKLIEA